MLSSKTHIIACNCTVFLPSDLDPHSYIKFPIIYLMWNFMRSVDFDLQFLKKNLYKVTSVWFHIKISHEISDEDTCITMQNVIHLLMNCHMEYTLIRNLVWNFIRSYIGIFILYLISHFIRNHKIRFPYKNNYYIISDSSLDFYIQFVFLYTLPSLFKIEIKRRLMVEYIWFLAMK